MGSASVPAELLTLRDSIDVIDAELLQALAKRFALTGRVGELKASMDLEWNCDYPQRLAARSTGK